MIKIAENVRSREGVPQAPPGARGFALPAAIFALLVLGVMITGGFYLAQQESRISLASEHASKAVHIAEQGLNEVRMAWNPPTYNGKNIGWDTVHVGTADGGNWRVRVLKTDSTNYFLAATGQVTEGGAMYSGATREIGMLARVVYPSITPPAAITTRGGLAVRGNATVSGTDQTLTGRLCPPSDDRTGILTDDTTQIQSVGNSNVEGDPPMDEDTSIDNSTFNTFGEVNYNQLVAMSSIQLSGGSTVNPDPSLDADGNCDYSDDRNWGDPENPTAPCGDYYPVIHIAGNGSIQSDGAGQGILLVDGDLQIQGAFSFYGIIIVQGTLDTRGAGVNAPRIMGGVYAGNAEIESQGGAGQSRVYTSNCAVQEAVRKSFTASRPLPVDERSWVDLSSASY